MMFKEKKLSKFALICCSFIIALSAMLAINPSWINNIYGTTLCATQSEPSVDSTWFDITNPNFINNIDYVTEYVQFVPNGNYGGIANRDYVRVTLTKISDSLPSHSITSVAISGKVYNYNKSIVDGSYSVSSTTLSSLYAGSNYVANTIDFLGAFNTINLNNSIIVFLYNDVYYTVFCSSLYNSYLTYVQYSGSYANGYNDGVAQGQNNVINNPNDYNLYNQTQYDSNYTNGYNAGVIQGQNNVINNPHNYGLFTQADLDSEYQRGYRIGQEDIEVDPNSYGYYTDTQYQNNYDNGYRDGQESSTNYQEGIVTGQNNVINNPHNFGLFTQADLDSEYLRGYDYAVNLSKFGFTYESNLFVQLTDQAEFVPVTYDYIENGIKLTQESIDYIANNFVVSNNYIQFRLVAKHDLSIMYPTFNFFENGVSQNTIDTFGGTAKDIDGSIQSLISMQYFYNSINRDGIVTGDNVANFNPASYRGGDWTGTITNQYLNTDLYDITLLNYDSTHKYYNFNTLEFGFDFNSSDLSKLFIRDYNQSYINGYEDGRTMINSNAYNEGYDKGYDTAYNLSYSNAYNEGKSDGINSANQFSFYSLISSVVDAPLNMFKSMFNFEFLGVNLFSFFTSIFTLCLVVFIISKFLKK